MDPISQALRMFRPAVASIAHRSFMAPWRFEAPGPEALAATRSAPDRRILAFHVVIEGACRIELAGHRAMHLGAGDAVLFPYGHQHVLTSDAGVAAADNGTQLLCGFIGCERHGDLVLGGLPAAMRVNTRESQQGGWIQAAAHQALRDLASSRAGREGALSKLAELIAIELIRIYIDSGSVPNVVAGSHDRLVVAALHAIHELPARNWTLASLAKHVGSSRSVLAGRFQQALGTTVMHYLAHLRMSLAASLLSRSDCPLIQIADKVGYRTDTAFSRAFRREYGMPPARWRRHEACHAPARRARVFLGEAS